MGNGATGERPALLTEFADPDGEATYFTPVGIDLITMIKDEKSPAATAGMKKNGEFQFSGFADEAGCSLDTQIQATKELDWSNIEMRNVQVAGFPSGNLHDISDEAFAVLADQLDAAGIRVNSLGSEIANGGKDIRKPFDECLASARRAAPRAQRLGAEFIRIMSYPTGDPAGFMEEERFRRLREVVRIFAGTGVTVVHENCHNYGSMGGARALKLLENVPGLKLVFDTGNPVMEVDYTKSAPHPRLSALEFYRQVREHVVYVHIKDAILSSRRHVFPGEGEGQVREILQELIAGGYAGALSIEPHMGAGLDDASLTPEENTYQTYVEYGRRLMRLVGELCVKTEGRR